MITILKFNFRNTSKCISKNQNQIKIKKGNQPASALKIQVFKNLHSYELKIIYCDNFLLSIYNFHKYPLFF